MRQASRLRLDAKTRDDTCPPSSHIQKAALRINRQWCRATCHRDLLLQRELARGGVHGKACEFVVPLQGYIHDIWHGLFLMCIVGTTGVLGGACVELCGGDQTLGDGELFKGLE